MNKGHFGLCLVSSCAGLLMCGCSRTPLVFATHTSIGLDVSGTAQYPNRVSLSYDREETALVPRQTSGDAHSVFGGLDADISFWNGSEIKQRFATGEAAKLAVADGPRAQGIAVDVAERTRTGTDPLVFLTGSTLGLHLTAGESKMSPSLLMGYRRIEAAYIPIVDPSREVSSVYADVLINTKSVPQTNLASAILGSTNFSTVGGARIKQSFATGRAAESLVCQEDVRAKLRSAAGLSAAELKEVAVSESDIMKRVEVLSESKRTELYKWADSKFGKESGGKLVESNSLDYFENTFLPKLDDDGRAAVLQFLTK